MKLVTFITGNQNKADYLAKYLGYPVDHKKLDLEEIQSMDLSKIVTHKVKQAYSLLKTPVIVEDVSLEFKGLGNLPGPFIKYFVNHVSDVDICSLVDNKSRDATARCIFGYYDGDHLELFEGGMNGMVAKTPAGENGYGFDRIFIPEGYSVTRAELSKEDDQKTYLQIKPFKKLKEFLTIN